MTKSKTQRRKGQTRQKSAFALAMDEFKRLTWQSRVLRVSSWVALAAVEGVVAWFIADHAPDILSAAILTSMAVLCGLGIILGPSYVLALRKGLQRRVGWGVIAACLFVSGWNLSSTIGTNWSEQAAEEAQSSPTFSDDLARLASLNRSIDALADEVGGMYGNQDVTYSNMLAERDRLQERVDQGRSEFKVFGTPEAWVRGLGFHAIVLGFSTAFAMAGLTVPRRQRKRRGAANEIMDDNVIRAAF